MDTPKRLHPAALVALLVVAPFGFRSIYRTMTDPAGMVREQRARAADLDGSSTEAAAVPVAARPATPTPDPLYTACLKSGSTGETEADKDQAARACAVFRKVDPRGEQVELVSIQQSATISVYVTKPFYEAMAGDRLAAHGFVRQAMSLLRTMGGKKAVGARIYVGDVRVAEGDTSLTGEDEIKLLLK